LAVLIFGEMVPKTLGVLKAEPIALSSSPILSGLLWLLYPLVFGLNLCANGILRLFGLYPANEEDQAIGLDELRTMVLESAGLRVRRRQMLLGAMELEEAIVEDIMVPRSRIEGIDLDEDQDSIVEQLRTSRFTHLPVYEDDIGNLV